MRPKYTKATIKDVAAEAGVSISTVSRFVGGHVHVCSPETARRIRSVIAAMHYTPSSLTPGRSRHVRPAIGVCVQRPYGVRHAFTDGLWRGVNAEADAQGYLLLSYPADIRDAEDHRLFLDGRIAGLIMSVTSMDDRPRSLAAAGMPTVLVGASLSIPDGCAAAYMDEARGVELALTHLWRLGHRRIAHLAGPTCYDLDRPTVSFADQAQWRDRAYREWMASRGVPPLSSTSARSWDDRQGAQVLKEWRSLPQPPTAVFCANDLLASAAWDVARQIGWSVPSELSLVGVDNDPLFSEGLTTVEVDADAIGQEAFRCVLGLMDGLAPCRVVVPPSGLVIRGSTAIASD